MRIFLEAERDFAIEKEKWRSLTVGDIGKCCV